MAQHEPKHCPRCSAPFECKVGSILQCQCSGLTFNDFEWDYIRLTYTDCLCRSCLKTIKHEMSTKNVQQKMKDLLAPIKRP